MKDYQPASDLLKDRVILITGAGQGIGKTAALAFAHHGATVILTGRKVEKLEMVYDEIEQAGGSQPAIFPLDMEKATDMDFQAMAQAIEVQLGRLDGILHNASRLDNLSPLELQTLDQWLGILRVNLAAPFALTKACLPLLKKAPDAAIVMTSESHSQNPAPYWGAFAISKHAQDGLVKMWAQELEQFENIRINSIIPGPVKSPQRAKTHPGELKDNLPDPETLMPLYLYLMGPDSKNTSGQIFTAQ